MAKVMWLFFLNSSFICGALAITSECMIYEGMGNSRNVRNIFSDVFPLDTLHKRNKSYMVDLHFSTSISASAYILLTSDSQILDPRMEGAYAIGIGTNSNSEIRVIKGTLDNSYPMTGILSSIDIQSFYLQVKQNGFLSIGREGDEPFFTWRGPDVNDIDIKYFGFGTNLSYNFNYYYNCSDSYVPHYPANELPQCLRNDVVRQNGNPHRYLLTDLNGSSDSSLFLVDLHFSVRATSDAFVKFSSAYDEYKINFGFGTTFNQGCQIVRNDGPILDTFTSKGIVSGAEIRSFWIRITINGLIFVGKEHDDNSFITIQIPNPLPIRYVQFDTYKNMQSSFFFNCKSPVY